MRKGLFNFFFEHSPYLIGLTMADLETGERAFHRWIEHLDRTIKDMENIPGAGLLGTSSERIPTSDAFGRLDQACFSERLEDFLEVVFRQVLGFSQGANRKRPIRLGKSDRGTEPVVCLF